MRMLFRIFLAKEREERERERERLAYGQEELSNSQKVDKSSASGESELNGPGVFMLRLGYCWTVNRCP